MTTPDASTPLPTAASTASVWEDFIDIFYAPSQVFERRKAGQFGLALLIIVVVATILFLLTKSLIFPAIQSDIGRGLAKAAAQNPGMDVEAARGTAEKMSGTFGPILVAVATPIIIMLTGLVLWLVGKLVESTADVAPAIMVATYSYIPRLLAIVAAALLGLVLPPEQMNGMSRLSVGVAHFLDPDASSPLMIALAARLDLFVIWDTILLGIGLSVVGKIPRSRAMVAAGIVWVLGVLPAVLQAAR